MTHLCIYRSTIKTFLSRSYVLTKNTKELIFIGGSTAVSEIMQIVNKINKKSLLLVVKGALDDNESLHNTSVDGVPVLGNISKWKEFPDAEFIYAIGSSKTRLKRLDILKNIGIPEERFATLIDPSANVYETASIGAGCIIHYGATIGPNVEISPFGIVTMGVNLGPNVKLGKGAMVASGVFIGSNTCIGPCAFLGAASAIAENITIGAGAMVGMGTIVFRSVPNGQFVLGNPAKPVFTFPIPDSLLENQLY